MYIDLQFGVDLKQSVSVSTIKNPLIYNDSQAHRITIKATSGGSPVELSGTVTAQFIRASVDYVALQGTIENGNAVVVLPAECYAVNGNCGILIRVTNGTQVVTIANIRGRVGELLPGAIVDPGSRITRSIDELIDTIVTTRQSIPADYTAVSRKVDELYTKFSVNSDGDVVMKY